MTKTCTMAFAFKITQVTNHTMKDCKCPPNLKFFEAKKKNKPLLLIINGNNIKFILPANFLSVNHSTYYSLSSFHLQNWYELSTA